MRSNFRTASSTFIIAVILADAPRSDRITLPSKKPVSPDWPIVLACSLRMSVSLLHNRMGGSELYPQETLFVDLNKYPLMFHRYCDCWAMAGIDHQNLTIFEPLNHDL